MPPNKFSVLTIKTEILTAIDELVDKNNYLYNTRAKVIDKAILVLKGIMQK